MEELQGAALTSDGADGGKMFAVLVVSDAEGRIGFLRAFSGMLQGRWRIPGFVSPLFDDAVRERVEVPGESVVKALTRRAELFAASPGLAAARADHDELLARHAAERASLRRVHEAQRLERRERRAALAGAAEENAAALHALDQESRRDKAERRRMDARHEEEEAPVSRRRARLERRLRALDRLRQIVCRALMRQLHDTYVVPNARGQTRPLRTLYEGEPPSGAADCAGPKLLAHAYRSGLRPIALAEFWWGAPPRSGGRVHGAFYPACRDKCGPLLPFMLEGLEVALPRTFVPAPTADDGLRVLHEDPAFIVVDKPAGLLAIPGKGAALQDSALTRLRARFPSACGPNIVHRLDLDTSGLMVMALTAQAHASLQRQFLTREVHKRYVAWVDGHLGQDRGHIDLALRVDLHDRPRQIHDPVHGKRALTEWEVLERRGERTLVALYPLTGRTHQLRVHAAHPMGLGAPIVGDRLYGREEGRLHLHAQTLTFTHPTTGERLTFVSPPPF